MGLADLMQTLFSRSLKEEQTPYNMWHGSDGSYIEHYRRHIECMASDLENYLQSKHRSPDLSVKIHFRADLGAIEILISVAHRTVASFAYIYVYGSECAATRCLVRSHTLCIDEKEIFDQNIPLKISFENL